MHGGAEVGPPLIHGFQYPWGDHGTYPPGVPVYCTNNLVLICAQETQHIRISGYRESHVSYPYVTAHVYQAL